MCVPETVLVWEVSKLKRNLTKLLSRVHKENHKETFS